MANTKPKCPMCDSLRVTRFNDLNLCDDCAHQWPAITPDRDEPLFKTEKETKDEPDQKFQAD